MKHVCIRVNKGTGIRRCSEQHIDANALATILWEVWNKPNSNEMKIVESARRATDERRLELAKQYQRIVLKAVEQTR